MEPMDLLVCLKALDQIALQNGSNFGMNDFDYRTSKLITDAAFFCFLVQLHVRFPQRMTALSACSIS